ncbi:hypothetical protein SEUCBS139899_003562 [Sporothrix eucalyptigena]|uniref:Arylsulfatase n=1 Tax=Sporothrix eucalyptigena TaxID=1812306 RepID=A0ABP0B6G3_9PEZI
MKAGSLIAGVALLAGHAAAKQPNILFILTDDMDSHMEAMEHMPLLQKHLINEGTVFSRHYCTVALCCPSRVNIFTGRAAHNTNVTDVWAPYGGYPKVVREGINDDYLPHWLQAAGYNTYYAGKMWNQHSVENYNAPHVGGFNESDFLLDPFTYEYWNATMTRNGAPPVRYEGQYSPDLTADKAYDFLREALRHKDRPWFVAHAPIAPHGNVHFPYDESDETKQSKPGYAERHAHLFKDYKIPRGESFNPAEQGGVSWIANLPRLNDTVIAYNDEFQRSRLRALQSVDESTAALLQLLKDAGELDNTYIFYTTDNGYHISQHRMHPGKECGFETDVHIPMIVRGPGVPRGHVSEAVTSHTDIASTIMELAGRPLENTDGVPMPLSLEAEANARMEHVTIEYWGLAIPEGELGWYGDANMTDDYGSSAHAAINNTYKGLRVIGDTYSLYYAVWCTNETELYNLMEDPFEVRNLLDANGGHAAQANAFRIAGRSLDQVVSRLNALLVVLKTCARETCREPWRALHPQGDVATLEDSLAPHFDAFYAGQPNIYFTKCEIGYIAESEGPMYVNRFGGGIHQGYVPTNAKSAPENGDEVAGYDRKALKYLGPQHRISIWT